MLNTADIGTIMKPMDIRRRMPCRPRGELIPLQHDNIAPPKFGQMIEDRASNYAATNDDCLRVGFHDFLPFRFVLANIRRGAAMLLPKADISRRSLPKKLNNPKTTSSFFV